MPSTSRPPVGRTRKLPSRLLVFMDSIPVCLDLLMSGSRSSGVQFSSICDSLDSLPGVIESDTGSLHLVPNYDSFHSLLEIIKSDPIRLQLFLVANML